MLFRKTGTAAIESAIAQFEGIASRIEAGVGDNYAKIEKHTKRIAELQNETDELHRAISRGKSVAHKLRELVK